VKWNYAFVICNEVKGILRPLSVNGRGVSERIRGELYNEFAEELGQQGWELISYETNPLAAINGSNVVTMVFKRPSP